eukprot:scaffold5285_cov137-Isochrysis_galbana.AAC.4
MACALCDTGGLCIVFWCESAAVLGGLCGRSSNACGCDVLTRWRSLAMLAQSQRRRPPTSTSHERLVVVCPQT